MDIKEFRDFCLSLGAVDEKIPFAKFSPRYASTLAFYVGGHMFCITDIDDFTYVDVKADPAEIDELLAAKISVSRPINPTLKNWVTVALGGDVTDDELRRLAATSYHLVLASHSKA